MFYVAEARIKLKADEPNLKPTEILTRAGENWKNLPADQKKVRKY
jgi:hypothetical protein